MKKKKEGESESLDIRNQCWLVWLMRIAIGSIFIFSGFSKGVDPFGTLYKFREYITAAGIWMPDSVLLTGVILLCGIEFLLGLFLVTGCYRKSAPLGAGILMCFMILLTGWIAVSDPIDDCGCFGDAFQLSNWATFFKNILIIGGIIYLIKMNREAPCLITPYLQWLALMGGAIFIVAISLYGYEIQPLVDYRQFKTGTQINNPDEEEDESSTMRFIYKKGSELKEFSVEDIQPSEEEGWEFVERIERKNSNSKLSHFSVYTIDGEENEVTEDVLAGKSLLILAPELERVSKSVAWKIEALSSEAQREGLKPVFIVSGPDMSINVWRDLLDPGVDIYKSEDTVIKMIVRGNPGVVYLDNGNIKWKSTMRALPIEPSDKKSVNYLKEFSREDRSILMILCGTLIGWIAFLSLLSWSKKMIGTHS